MSIDKFLFLLLLLFLIPSASAVNQIVANWTMNEGTGILVNDTSGFNNNGTITGATWTTDNIRGGYALSFNGSGNYVTVPASTGLNLRTAFTLSTWFKANLSTTKGGLISKTVGGSTNTQYELYYDTDEKIIVRAIKGGAWNTLLANSSIQNNTWTYATATYDGSTLRLYINGILQSSTLSLTSPIDGGSGVTYLGALQPGVYEMKGIMDEAKIYNYSLTQSEINNLIKDYPRVFGWNNITFNDSISFQTLRKPIKFNFTVPGEPTYIWWVNGVVQSSTTNIFEYNFTGTGTFYINVTTPTSAIFNNWSIQVSAYNLEALTPINGSTQTNPVTFTWREWETDLPHTLYIATDNLFNDLVSTSTITTGTDENFTTTISGLTEGTKYYWRVKNNSGFYTNTMNFTLVAASYTPGRFNLSVWDEANLTFPILNYTAQFYNSTTLITRTTTTGWVNLSADEIASGEYLIIVTPSGTFSNYFPRMVLSTSPTNVTMYVPNSTSPNTVDIISFSLLDVTGFFPYQTSVISVYKGGLLMEKSYFSQDGTHSVYLLQGTNYNINVQNGAYLFSGNNFIPYASGSSTITINDFSVNTTGINPFVYNITYDTNEITLRWNDVGGVLSSLNFTVHKGDPMVVECQLTTSVRVGQSVCAIDTTHVYHFIFSAALTDGTYRNASFLIDLTYGKRKTSTGTSTIDGSPIGTGFKWNYGTWTTPDWVYNYASLLLIILLAGSFGGYHSGIGGIVVVVFSILLEAWGLFRPLGDTVDPDNFITMGITGGIGLLVVFYYFQHKDRGG